ncbi:MAG: preprotein translocase subunit YajC [Clostridiales bacterium]|nr:preprotein translocase subunit YajC [Clostridiales bacterium]MBR6488217.1 preprotein translocase subunit YajC [Clostridiales bacterium]
MLDFILRAGETAGSTGAGTGTQEEMMGTMMGSYMSIGLLVLMFIVFYFILIRPQRKRDKELKEQMSKLSVGDRVVTIGGLVGFVANIKDNEITISTSAANTLVTFTKSAISSVVKRDKLNPDGSVKKDPAPEKKGLFGSKKKEEE